MLPRLLGPKCCPQFPTPHRILWDERKPCLSDHVPHTARDFFSSCVPTSHQSPAASGPTAHCAKWEIFDFSHVRPRRSNYVAAIFGLFDLPSEVIWHSPKRLFD